MTNPVHRLKKFVKYMGDEKPSSSYLTETSGWLSSGVKDVNNREIFEGDRVKFGEYERTGVVEFRNAMFVIAHDNSERFTVLGNTPNFVTVEIVGHAAEDEQ